LLLLDEDVKKEVAIAAKAFPWLRDFVEFLRKEYYGKNSK